MNRNIDIKKIDKNMEDSKRVEQANEIIFYNAFSNVFIVHGLYWFNENKNFHRLDDNLKTRDNLISLSHHSSGGYLSFKTNSKSISLKIKLSSAAYMAHMSACGQSGLDLYFKEKDNYIFLATTKINRAEYEITLIDGLKPVEREYRLYLPLYVELVDIEVGFEKNAIIERNEEINENKIVCYGTSISQGGCATRPGMNYSSILGRDLLDYDVINLGFSGNGFLDKEVALEIAKISKVKFLIIEAEANTGNGLLQRNLVPFLDVVTKIADIKILLVSHYPLSYCLVKDGFKEKLQANKIYQRKISKMYKNITFIDGEKLLKDLVFEETVDCYHLTDLGFYFISKKFLKYIRKNIN